MTVSILIFLLLTATVAWWRQRTRAQEAAERSESEMRRLREQHAEERDALAHRLETVLDSMIEGLIVLNTDGRIELVNRAAEKLFGISRMMIGGTLLETVRNHEVAAVATRVATEFAILGHEVRLEGTPSSFLRINAAALRDTDGVYLGAILVFHDLTRIRELEGQRQEFVANVSHELRTPLSLIKSATETLMDGALADPVALRKLLQIIDRHADRLTRLIDDLLLLSRLDSGRMALQPQPVALQAAIQESLDDLAPRAQLRQVRLESDFPAGLVARVDPERLRQVLSNLIDNAINYGRVGGRVVISGGALGNGQIEVGVRDDGPGIPPEAVLRIFERFYRVDKARSREQGGTGLGLAIVKHVVQAHGGEVRVESEPGQGAAFFFTLPSA